MQRAIVMIIGGNSQKLSALMSGMAVSVSTIAMTPMAILNALSMATVMRLSITMTYQVTLFYNKTPWGIPRAIAIMNTINCCVRPVSNWSVAATLLLTATLLMPLTKRALLRQCVMFMTMKVTCVLWCLLKVR